jgi:MFS family permease
MNSLLNDLLSTVFAPAGTALVIGLIAVGLRPRERFARWHSAGGAALGFFVGYWLLPEWAPLQPERHWQWLPYLALAAGAVGAIAAQRTIALWERAFVYLALSAAAALALVPTWENLQPPRPTMVALLTAYLAGLMTLLSALPAKLRGSTFTALLALTALSLAVLVAYEVSLKFAQLAAIAATAIGVCTLVLLRRSIAASNLGLIPVFVVLLGGVALASTIEPTKPAVPLLIVPAAPLSLWAFVLVAEEKQRRPMIVALKLAALGTIVALAAGWLMARAEPADEWSSRQEGETRSTACS